MLASPWLLKLITSTEKGQFYLLFGKDIILDTEDALMEDTPVFFISSTSALIIYSFPDFLHSNNSKETGREETK